MGISAKNIGKADSCGRTSVSWRRINSNARSLRKFPQPKPAYTTISTVIRVLVKKGFIGYKVYGKVHEYFPLIEKQEYFRFYFDRILKNHFSSSLKKFASFFANENNLSLTELEELKELVEEKIHEKKAEETWTY